MDTIQEQLEKEAKVCGNTAAYAHQAHTANIGYSLAGQAIHTPLRDRIQDQAQSAEYAASKANQLRELQYLLDKNPEVARILELMEVVR